MAKGNDILSLSEQLEACDGYKILNKIRLLGITYFIFMGNYKELKKAINYWQHPERALNLSSVENRNKLHFLLKAIIRHLHNYSASVMSLVEHTRKFARREYKGKPFLEEN